MSETVTYKGKLTPVYMTVQELFEVNDLEYDLGVSDEENLMNNFYEDHVIIDGILYSASFDDHSYEDIYLATKNEDNTFDFLVQYYNGAVSFDEAIKEAAKRSKIIKE